MEKLERTKENYIKRSSSETSEEEDEEVKKTDDIAILQKRKRLKNLQRYKRLCFPKNSKLERNYDTRTQLIFINKNSSRQCRENSSCVENKGAFESNESNVGGSNMAARKQLEFKMAPVERTRKIDRDTVENGSYENMEILRKLPPDTVVIKQDSRSLKDDSDYVRDSTETNSSGGSSSTSGYTAEKKRIHRTIRNKNRGNVQVRRNPVRVTKKDASKEFSRPRQRLLSAKRRESLADTESSKRSRLSTMPYMNTRSVTRKMYNVGATYQAPTIRDETEWKEWPVHGMHERPVYHPQAGLAAEYLGRYFISLDGMSYREIVEQPEIEVVSVDPRNDCPSSSSNKSRGRKSRSKSRNMNSTKTKYVSQNEKDQSFASCMHGSLHSVLAYCSQVMSPAYKKNVEEKVKERMREKEKPPAQSKLDVAEKSDSNSEENKFNSLVNSFDANLKVSTAVKKEENLESKNSFEGYTFAMSQNVKNSGKEKSASTVAQFSDLFKKSEYSNVESSHKKMQEIHRSTPKNSFVLVKTPEGKNFGAAASSQVNQPVLSNLSLNKLNDTTISDETLMEISSIYNDFISKEELTSNNLSPRKIKSYKRIPIKNHSLADLPLKKQIIEKQIMEKQQHSSQDYQKENKPKRDSFYSINDNFIATNSNNKSSSNDASEIAKILSEYNKSTTKKSAIQSQNYIPQNFLKSNFLKYANSKATKIEVWNNEAQINKDSQGAQATIKFPQGKWRRFHLTVEKVNAGPPIYTYSQSHAASTPKFPSTVTNPQTPLNISQPTICAFDSQEKSSQNSCKSIQTFQKEILQTESSTEKNEDVIVKNEEISETSILQDLIENTAILYCAASGVHQEDLANYIDTLDAGQSIKWLE